MVYCGNLYIQCHKVDIIKIDRYIFIETDNFLNKHILINYTILHKDEEIFEKILNYIQKLKADRYMKRFLDS